MKYGNTGADACIYYVFVARVIIFRTNKRVVEQRHGTPSRLQVTTKVRKLRLPATAELPSRGSPQKHRIGQQMTSSTVNVAFPQHADTPCYSFDYLVVVNSAPCAGRKHLFPQYDHPQEIRGRDNVKIICDV